MTHSLAVLFELASGRLNVDHTMRELVRMSLLLWPVRPKRPATPHFANIGIKVADAKPSPAASGAKETEKRSALTNDDIA